MAVYQKRKPYNPDVQVMAMRSKYPQFKVSRKDGDIIFTGTLQVKPELPIYKVQVIYRGEFAPRVYIVDPPPVKGAPHIYKNTGSLCLYHSKNYKWNAQKLVAADIMGWTAGWIYFYEYWLQSGKWIGPEIPHDI